MMFDSEEDQKVEAEEFDKKVWRSVLVVLAGVAFLLLMVASFYARCGS